MIDMRVKITDYDKDSNTFTAELADGEIIMLDPLVSCCIEMTDRQYADGYGFEFIGKSYVMQDYTVYGKDKLIVPIKMTEIK